MFLSLEEEKGLIVKDPSMCAEGYQLNDIGPFDALIKRATEPRRKRTVLASLAQDNSSSLTI